MEKVIIKILEELDTQALFKFEFENKRYFEEVGFARDDSYYDLKNFKAIVKDLTEEQEKDMTYMYLIKNSSDEIIGRVNLVSVVRGNLNKAELGYRIGEKHQGKGYATMAVKLVLNEAKIKHRLHRIEAGTSSDNIGSQIVLIKNGFQFTGRYNKYIFQNGEWNDSISFEKILD
ncbi:GNAT family N-acetyltransferase [Tissierella sp. Yu-01]|uniref:GNAT family N-acetyltransferase n=1 Tax=Tissierella sp. Yu-01 TaxID=3035694 RepID=UPI00240D1A9A|nr:GNAT family N-acetyltransferase [Tissierella sp. Yu-01]WFA08774.1 GNAT family N-acetyltransferase [Tissierella sp. Yu-01]